MSEREILDPDVDAALIAWWTWPSDRNEYLLLLAMAKAEPFQDDWSVDR